MHATVLGYACMLRVRPGLCMFDFVACGQAAVLVFTPHLCFIPSMHLGATCFPNQHDMRL